MNKFKVLICSLIIFILQAQAYAQSVTVSVDDKTFTCSEEKYKYYCDCKIMPNCGGLCWTPVYMRFEVATGNEAVVKYLDNLPSSEANCYGKITKFPQCK